MMDGNDDGNDDATYKDIRADNSATIAGIKVEHVETAGGTEQGQLVACAGGRGGLDMVIMVQMKLLMMLMMYLNTTMR